mmetsp:Transcript_35198/g.88716  ORF Transcript_35198/g.88716 Transcript_35198/m.88716 type:complete len:97 (+) Transcript_35198:75-365(+)
MHGYAPIGGSELFSSTHVPAKWLKKRSDSAFASLLAQQGVEDVRHFALTILLEVCCMNAIVSVVFAKARPQGVPPKMPRHVNVVRATDLTQLLNHV